MTQELDAAGGLACERKYYMCSKYRLFDGVGFATFGAMAAMIAGCAHTGSGPYLDPIPLRVNQLNAAALRDMSEGRPVIVEFAAGDRIPVELVVDGEVVATEPATATFALVAKRTFFLRIRGQELKTSFDGESFDAKAAAPGAFRIGLEKTTEKGPVLSVRIITPVHSVP
jgi:hypothetical protein